MGIWVVFHMGCYGLVVRVGRSHDVTRFETTFVLGGNGVGIHDRPANTYPILAADGIVAMAIFTPQREVLRFASSVRHTQGSVVGWIGVCIRRIRRGGF